MPFIINQSFFVGDLNIPNLSSATAGTAILERLNVFIAKYEPQCLLQILGYPLYKVFTPESSARMTDLLDGAEYVDAAGNIQKWQGLVHDDLSLIAAYIYYFYQQASASQSTGINTQIPKGAAGATPTSPVVKMVDAWNFFSKEVEDMLFFLWMKKDIDGNRVYPEFSASQYHKTKNLSRTINEFNF